ncbi:MAG: hypothetical protein ACRD4F_13785, partial [Candidatus Angelobacter sp.]
MTTTSRIVLIALAASLWTPITFAQQGALPREQSSSAAGSGAASQHGPALPITLDPKEIVRRSVETDHRTLELARNYTCRNREVVKELGKHGEVKSTRVKT